MTDIVEVVPGIRQMKVPLPDKYLKYVYVYLLETKDGYLMVDTGWNNKESLDGLTDGLKSAGVDFRDISIVMCTHFHPDHFGNAKTVMERGGAQLLMHRLDPPREVRRPHGSKLAFVESMQDWLTAHGFPEEHAKKIEVPRDYRSSPFPTVKTDIEADDGTTIEGKFGPLQIYWTPGHTPGHICLYDPQRKVIFSGDHVLPQITPGVSVHHEGEHENPLGDFIASLRKIRDLDVDLVCPGHQWEFDGLARRVDEIIAHHEERCEAIITAIRQGHGTSYAIASRIKWNVGTWDEMSDWLHQAALGETLAHVDYLVAEGRLTKRVDDGRWAYAVGG